MLRINAARARTGIVWAVVSALLFVGCGDAGGSQSQSSGVSMVSSSVPEAAATRSFDVEVDYPDGAECRLEGTPSSLLTVAGPDAWIDTDHDGSPDAILVDGFLYLQVPEGDSKGEAWWKVAIEGQKDMLQFVRGLQQGADTAVLLGSGPDPFRVPQRYADEGVDSPTEVFPGDPDGGIVSWDLDDHQKVTKATVTIQEPERGQALRTAVTLRSSSRGPVPDVSDLHAATLGDAPAVDLLPLSNSLDPACSDDQRLDWRQIDGCVADLAEGKTVGEWLEEHTGIDALRPVACFPETS